MICAVKERAQSRSADKWSDTQSMGTRRAVSAVREERAHVMEQFIHLLRCLPLRSGRSSFAGLVAPDRTFRAAETPGGSHNGSQPNAARVTAPVRSPRHSHVPWLYAPISPGTSPHAQARPTCSNSISPRGCRTLRFWRPRRACSSRWTSRPSSRRPRAAVTSIWRSEASWSRRRCLHSALGGGRRSK